MKKAFRFIGNQIKYFIVNPFWSNKANLLIICLTLLLNGLIWFFYIKNFRDLIGVVPISYSSAVVVLNVFLACIVFKKEALASLVLLGTGLSIQIFFLVFLKFFAMSKAF